MSLHLVLIRVLQVRAVRKVRLPRKKRRVGAGNSGLWSPRRHQ